VEVLLAAHVGDGSLLDNPAGDARTAATISAGLQQLEFIRGDKANGQTHRFHIYSRFATWLQEAGRHADTYT
jgi:hypothetical protein